MLLDYTAAIDSIDHTTMIGSLLRGYGIKGCALKWLDSYLDQQHIVVNDSISRPFSLPWPPQGSVLGPLEFILYTAPLSAVIFPHRDILRVMYADDTQTYVIKTSKHQEGSMQKLSECIWFRQICMLINANTFYYVFIYVYIETPKRLRFDTHYEPESRFWEMINAKVFWNSYIFGPSQANFGFREIARAVRCIMLYKHAYVLVHYGLCLFTYYAITCFNYISVHCHRVHM